MSESDRARPSGRAPRRRIARRHPAPRDVAGPRSHSGLWPDSLYKTAALLFLLAALYRHLDAVVHVLLLAYAAAILGVLANALVQRLPLRRKWSAGALGVLVLASIAALLWFGIPALLAQVRSLAAQLPLLSTLVENVESWLRANTGLNVNLVGEKVHAYLQSAFVGTADSGADLLSRARGLLDLLLIPLLILFGGLYAVGDPNERLLSPLLRAIPRERRPAARRVLQLLSERLLGWIKGVLIGMVSVALLSYVGYRIAGVPNALALAVVAGVTEAIPLLGPWIGGTIATATAFLHDPTTGLYAAIVAVAVQQLENNLIIPWAMSRSAAVHPFVTLFALILFGKLFGFLGVLLSIPLVLLFGTLIQVLWIERAIDTDEDPISPLVEE